MNKTKPPTSNKQEIREKVKLRISLLSKEENEEAAKMICKKLLELSIFQISNNIIIYQPLQDEVSLKYFIEQAQEQNKNIITITPSGDSPHLPTAGIIIVPGRAFTLSGKRVGRGGGWYDRFLRKYPGFHKIGICYNYQIFSDLPQEEHDISMNEVIVG